MGSNWRNLNEAGLLNHRTAGIPPRVFELAARFVLAPNTYLTNAKVSTNATITVTVQSDPHQPYVAAQGLFLFDPNVTPHFPYGAAVMDDG